MRISITIFIGTILILAESRAQAQFSVPPCQKIQSFFLEALKHCRDQTKYKDIISKLDVKDCGQFSKNFFPVFSELINNESHKKDRTCFAYLHETSELSEALPKIISQYYRTDFASLALASNETLTQFMKLPLQRLYAVTDYLWVADKLPKESADRRRLYEMSFDEMQSRMEKKAIHPNTTDAERIARLEKELQRKMKKWVNYNWVPISGCTSREKGNIVVAEAFVPQLKRDNILNHIIKIAQLEELYDDDRAPHIQEKTFSEVKNLLEEPEFNGWLKQNKMMDKKIALLKQLRSEDPSWKHLRPILNTALKKYDAVVDEGGGC